VSCHAMAQEPPCTLLIQYESVEPPNISELRAQLQEGSTEEKIAAMKKVILLLLNGETLPNLVMTIIQFVMPSKDHTIKKLALLYWEVCEKASSEGKLLFLGCNELRKDLNHPNEYVRGVTLRFLCKLKEVELLEPLIPSIRNNLEHRHSYVRRNAILAIYSIYKSFQHLIPDGPELIFNFLTNEGDASCQRNAFIMLFNCAQDKAVEYLSNVLDQVKNFGDILQFIIVELVRKVCRTNPDERAKYLRCLFTLLESSSPAVQFEASSTLIYLTSAPTAIKAAATTFIKLLCDQSDQNVKMIVLDRLEDIKRQHPKVMQELIMDILRALNSPSLDLKKKTLAIALDLVTPHNIDEVVLNLKKEINKTQNQFEQVAEYRQLLIKSIHACAVKYPNVAGNVVHLLIDFLGDSNWQAAVDVITFTREVIETYTDLREPILKRLLVSLRQIRSSKVYRSTLWIVGEYAQSTEEIDEAFSTISEELGKLPFYKEAKKKAGEEQDDEEENTGEKGGDTNDNEIYVPSSGAVVLSDGTYATQTIFSETSNMEAASRDAGGGLRRLLQAGDFFLGSVLANTLTKLVLRSRSKDIDTQSKNLFEADVLLILVHILKLGMSKMPKNPIDPDSYTRISTCIQIISNRKHGPLFEASFLQKCRAAFSFMLREENKEKEEKAKSKEKEVGVQVDDLLRVGQLLPKKSNALAPGSASNQDVDGVELLLATGYNEKPPDPVQKLSRLKQLTGLSDPVYAEAYINVHQYDIVLDITIINQTPDTLQNLSLELATMGDLKLCERPQNLTLGPFGHTNLKANIKVSSTESGIIFGTIVYDISGMATCDANCVMLNDIHIDIMDYISPATCTHLEFRAMWQEFEWENKVAVNTTIDDANEFLQHILATTNMNCLTSRKFMEGDCGFLSANLYAKSVFGEDALANLSIEQQKNSKIQGFIRIRSKTQGIALSLGDKITMQQRVRQQQTQDQ